MATELVVHLERTLSAPPALAFSMHVQPELLAQWWGPKGFSVPDLDLDVRVGGRYWIAMQPPEGDVFHLSGEFSEVVPPSRLAYTFRWEPPDPNDQETRVVVSFRDVGESTQLTVDQGTFVNEERRALHENGWSEALDRLEQLIASRGPT